MKRAKLVVAAAAMAVTVGGAAPARAEFLEDAGWGSLTVLTNIFYMPGKMLYSGLGGLTGGLAYGLTGGDLEVANKVWVPSMGGTYVVTPDMLRGEKEIAFVGGEAAPAAARNEYAPSYPQRAPAPASAGEGDLAEEDLGAR